MIIQINATNPPSIYWSAGQIVVFTATIGNAPVTWRMNPEIGAGHPDPATGEYRYTYTAPDAISLQQEIRLPAQDAQAKPLGEARVILSPPIRNRP